MQTKTLRTDLFLHSSQIKIMGKSFVDMSIQCDVNMVLSRDQEQDLCSQISRPAKSILSGGLNLVCVCGLGSPRGWWPKGRAEARS